MPVACRGARCDEVVVGERYKERVTICCIAVLPCRANIHVQRHKKGVMDEVAIEARRRSPKLA
jgi:hypothetical protein